MDLINLSYADVTPHEFKSFYTAPEHLQPQGFKRKLTRAKSFNQHVITHELEQKGIQVITIFDDLYPELLKEIYDPPYILYCKGDVALLGTCMLGVVGSRKAGIYSRQALMTILPELAGATIVSGLAYGADDMAHTISLSHGLPTIGVLGFGHDHHYPKSTQATRGQIETYGLTISEYPPASCIDKWKFIARNRIIAGLSLGVLVTEAEEKSGSLITLEMAMNDNRSAMCIPGNITSKLSAGTNRRIQEGAKPVLNHNDIMEELGQILIV